ncbi:MAG: hypothetical protein QOJ51_6542, partial [Acidobacteriaceae bacterium]|nr:hypothetical protein [Acidobacteriaceae bacterium]
NTAPGLPRDYGRAATPIFRSSGVVFPDTNGRPIGAYSCATSSPSGNTVRGVYIKLEFPIFTDLKASFNGQAVEYWATPPVPHSLYEGPRATPMHFWFEKEEPYSGGQNVVETVAINVPITPWRAELKFWVESQNPSLTGTNKVSLPLIFYLGEAPTITRFDALPGEGVPDGSIEERSHMLFLTNGRYDELRITGPGILSSDPPDNPRAETSCLPEGVLSSNLTYTATASFIGCIPVTRTTSVTLKPEVIGSFVSTGSPVPASPPWKAFSNLDNQPYTLSWNIPDPNVHAATLSGPGINGSLTVSSSGSKSFPAMRVPTVSLPAQTLEYQFTFPSPGACRPKQVHPLRIINNAVLRTFSFAIRCSDPISGSQCRDSGVLGHDHNEAQQIAQALNGACTVQLGSCP